MNKSFLTLFFSFLFFLLGTVSYSKSQLECQLYNSTKCKDPIKFQEQVNAGCKERTMSNCRLKFCRTNCLGSKTPLRDANTKLYFLCKKECLPKVFKLLRRDLTLEEKKAYYERFITIEQVSARVKRFGKP